MAIETPKEYRQLVLYEIFVRSHSPSGTFKDVTADLERISKLGVDVIWLMPIHPIGELNRKGEAGSPYSISNYRAINPEYGTLTDFQELLAKAHSLGLKVLIDVVYNHTAHDSILVKDHPDWYHQNEQGRPVTTVPAWADVIDLKYPNHELEEYLLESLVGWVKIGVDGFRCDVASLVPVNFWLRARERVRQVNPDTIWLAESVHASFVGTRREDHLRAFSDSEIYNAFDMEYEYDLWSIWQAAVSGRVPVARYLEIVRLQNCIYPSNYVKMRCVENHDQARIMHVARNTNQALAWTAFAAFNSGSFMIYAGQESGVKHTPSLFYKDPIDWGNYSYSRFISALAAIKKDPVIAKGVFRVSQDEPVIVAHWEAPDGCLLGIFNVQGSGSGKVPTAIPDGDYRDLISGSLVTISNSKLDIPESAVIFWYASPTQTGWFYSDLLDLFIPPDSQG